MNKAFAVLLGLLLLLRTLSYAQKDPKELTFPDIQFKPLKPKVAVIQKGITFYYQQHHEIPAVNATAILKIGELNDPVGQEGLAALTFNLLQTGGTTALSADQVEERLDFLGSNISVTVDTEFAYLSLWSLSKNFDESWKIFLDIIMNPRFDSQRFEVGKKQELESIRRRWDEPRQIGFILFRDLIYGKNFPDMRRTTTQSIDSITIEDIKSFSPKFILNNELIIAFAGDFQASKISSLLKKNL